MSNRITRITTKRGDAGSTRLADGKVHQKGDDAIELVGVLDEANAAVGVLVQFVDHKFHPALIAIQSRLFDIGAAVATGVPQDVWHEETESITTLTEELNATLAPLREFVLPGGGKSSAFAHVARTTVRRAERVFWRTASDAFKNSGQGAYLNRVSDYLFALGRVLADKEQLWEQLKRNEP